jgi:hypothetical protein
MNQNPLSNKNLWIVVLLGVGLSVIAGLLITKRLVLGGKKNYSSYRWFKDKKTRNIVENLHPKFRYKVAEFFSKIEDKLGFTAYGTSGYRTFKQQQELHKQNSSNAKAGYSTHNYGFAIDINVKDKNGNIFLRKSDSSKKWRDSGVVRLSENLGFLWGGDGNFGSYHDPVHFYIKPKGKSTSELLALHKYGKIDDDGYVLV